MPFTALHRLLGKDADAITDALIDEAVAAKLAETDDLDWKSELPPARGLSATDFPKDVAAMANTGGGTLVYGVTEDGKRATGRTDVGELTENHQRALRAAAYNAVVPPVFGLDITVVGEEGQRAVVVVVPASTDGPHLIYNNQYFGAPLRNDADTAWMKERQIEAAYRARLEGQRRAITDLNDLWREVNGSLPGEIRAQLVAVARPRAPLASSLRPPQEEAAAWFQAAHSIGRSLTNSTKVRGRHPLDSVFSFAPRAGLRRWVAPSKTESGRDFRRATAEIHHDGAVALSAVVGGTRNGDAEHPDFVVEARDIEAAVADLMALIRVVAAARGGREYDVELGIEWVGDPLRIYELQPHTGLHDPDAPIFEYVHVKTTVSADSSDADFHRETRDLALDAISQGGVDTVVTIVLADLDPEE